jgi:hypothetical protein
MKIVSTPSMCAQAAAMQPTGPAPKIASVDPSPMPALSTAW